jgi:hypothetical protein
MVPSRKDRILRNVSSGLQRPLRILLGQLKSSGDCLYATTIARQIKVDYPGCHLTWAIGSMYRSILEGNPDVDAIWVIPLTGIDGDIDAWEQFEREALARKRKGEFDKVFLTQIAPGNLHNYDGSIRSSIFRGYPGPIKVPISPVLRLSLTEVENVCRFVGAHRLNTHKHVILFECSPKSDQSFVTLELAVEVARKLVAAMSDVAVILSSDVKCDSNHERIMDGSVLSLRENAELTKFCSLLVGCSSGISWVCTSDWAKPLPMLQLLKRDAFWFASVVYDYSYWGLSTDTIIEITNGDSDKIVRCIEMMLTMGPHSAKKKYHQQIPHNYIAYRCIMSYYLKAGDYSKALALLVCNIQRNADNVRLMLLTLAIICLSGLQVVAHALYKLFCITRTYLIKYL